MVSRTQPRYFLTSSGACTLDNAANMLPRKEAGRTHNWAWLQRVLLMHASGWWALGLFSAFTFAQNHNHIFMISTQLVIHVYHCCLLFVFVFQMIFLGLARIRNKVMANTSLASPTFFQQDLLCPGLISNSLYYIAEDNIELLIHVPPPPRFEDYHPRLMEYQGWNLGLCACYPRTLLTTLCLHLPACSFLGKKYDAL